MVHTIVQSNESSLQMNMTNYFDIYELIGSAQCESAGIMVTPKLKSNLCPYKHLSLSFKDASWCIFAQSQASSFPWHRCESSIRFKLTSKNVFVCPACVLVMFSNSYCRRFGTCWLSVTPF